MKKPLAGKIHFNISLFYLVFVLGIVYTISSPVLIEIGDKIGRNISDTGLMFSFYFGGFISGSLASSLLVKFFNRKKLILFFIFLITISTFTVFFIFTYAFLLATFFLIGISIGFIEAQTSVLMMEFNRESEGLFVNLIQVFFGLGAFIGPLLPVALIKTSIDWKYIYLIASSLCLIGFIYLTFTKFPLQSSSENSFGSSFIGSSNKNHPVSGYNDRKDIPKGQKINKKPVIIFLILAMFFYVCAETGLAAWMPTFLRLSKSFDLGLAGQVLSFFWLATFAGRIITGFLTKKIKAVTILLFSTGLAIIFLVMGIFLKFSSFIIVSFILTGLFLSGLWPLIVTLGGMEYPRKKDFIISIILVSGGIGGLSAPWLLKLILDNFDLFIAFNANYVFLFFVIVFISGIYFYKRRQRI